MKIDYIYVVVLLIAVLISGSAQLLLKKSAINQHSSKIREYINRYALIAYFLIFLSMGITLLVMKQLPLSFMPVMESIGYVYVAIMSRIIFKEHLSMTKIVGIFCVFLGSVVFLFL